MVKTVTISTGTGKFAICLITSFTENGLVCQLFGGDRPHVGAVVLSVPRPSLRDSQRVSCNSSVLPMINHKDDELAKPVAEKLAKHFNQPVALVAGVHLDNASPEDINVLVNNCWLAVDQLLQSKI
ncbi:hypothetical protein Desca_1574 [Desulfotomaculum nigrificans CO-1-SRB]|uniref:Prenylated flavin chaperone LpdD-like domain-containing protein n=1 Tax=Desulfotomaculum nigrificans (strain DSM 14880 / VKM B-2319 / CO-1-SRB) TaxID=868595 RepID=F6B6Q3_DESCC|nr:hypothetical protein [Desulfotomaculum nigrificans]AEF94427.1 hypothetical protein Desca_1574 [Desulfotomaculum nigrificans CO-1-SRB]